MLEESQVLFGNDLNVEPIGFDRALFTEFRASPRVVEQFFDCGSERGRILCRNQSTVDTVFDNIGGSMRAIGSDYRRANSHCFHNDMPETFPTRRQYKYIGSGQPGIGIVEKSGKLHPVGYPALRCQALQRGFLRAISQDDDANILAI